jgi:hypothetical protein
MRPPSQAVGYLLAYDETADGKRTGGPRGPGFEFSDPAGWADIDPEA